MVARLLIGAALLTFAAPAYAEDWDFVLVNKTGKTIKQVEVAPSGSEGWTPEKVDEGMDSKIRNGQDHTVHFTKDDKACKFDVRLTFVDDTAVTARGLDVCDYAFAEFSFKGEALAIKGS